MPYIPKNSSDFMTRSTPLDQHLSRAKHLRLTIQDSQYHNLEYHRRIRTPRLHNGILRCLLTWNSSHLNPLGRTSEQATSASRCDMQQSSSHHSHLLKHIPSLSSSLVQALKSQSLLVLTSSKPNLKAQLSPLFRTTMASRDIRTWNL